MSLRTRLPLVPDSEGPDQAAIDHAAESLLPFLTRAATWATDLTYGDIPASVRRAAEAQRVSTVGAAVWSVSHPLGAAVGRTVGPRTDGPAAATYLGGGGLPPDEAAAGNAALSMALDFDDTVLGGHTGHSSVLVASAYAESVGISTRRAIVAQVAANEVAARLASAAAIGPFRGQQTAYIHAVGAAVVRAVIEEDDAETLADALGIALGQPPWPLSAAFLGSDAKLYTAAEPIRTGLTAIEAARGGLAGSTGLVEADDGFLEAFADRPLPEFLAGFGERWHTRAITVKQHPGCAYVSAPIEAALAVRELFPRGRTPIREVDVAGSLFTTEVDDLASPHLARANSPVSALTFTVGYNVAAALVDGEHTPRQLAPERVEDEAIWRVADRVRLEHDPAFTMAALRSEVPIGAMLRRVGPAVVPYAAKTVGVAATLRHLPTLLRVARRRPLPTELADADKRMGARVTATTDAGRTYEATVEHPAGFAGKPLAEIRAVARRKCRRGLEALGATESDARSLTDGLLEDGDPESLAPLAAVAGAQP